MRIEFMAWEEAKAVVTEENALPWVGILPYLRCTTPGQASGRITVAMAAHNRSHDVCCSSSCFRPAFVSS